MNKEKFTVVIPTYNRALFIEKAIESVQTQSFPHWKILVIDDASTDDTVDKVQPYLDDPRIRLIILPENKGISHVLNIALEEIDTPYFVQLDSDDCLSRHALRCFHLMSIKDPQAALLYGNIRMWRQTPDGKWRVFRSIRHRSFSNKYQFLVYMTYMLHPRCYRTAAVQDVGGWDTTDPYEGRVMEDRRMVVKLIEKYRIRWINQFLYHRRKHGEQLTGSEHYAARNELRRNLVLDSLEKWGNRYKPVFGYRKGFLIVKRLIPQRTKIGR